MLFLFIEKIAGKFVYLFKRSCVKESTTRNANILLRTKEKMIVEAVRKILKNSAFFKDIV